MKKLISSFSLLFILCASLLLVSCASECNHNYLTSKTVAPTCGEEGYTLNTCTECLSEFKTNYKLPTGHTLTETVFAPTCEKEGYTYYLCACGYSYTSNALPPSGHRYKDTKITSTCETAGYTEHICIVCEYTYKSDYISATGHTLQKTVIPPTEASVGYTEYTCSECGSGYKDDFVFYSDVFGGGYVDTPTVVAKGIDVSKWQNTPLSNGEFKSLNWQTIKESGVDFAILRAGYTGSETGLINKDPAFEINYRDAKAANVMVGAYYYSVAVTEEKLDEEIDALLGWLDGKQFEYPIYFDIEEEKLLNLEKDTLTKMCMRFVTRMRENGYYGAIYTNSNWLNEFLYREALEGFCDIWYAHYVPDSAEMTDGIYAWDESKYGSPLGMWQYTDSGIIDGSGIDASATVDMNYSYKDYASIIKGYGLNGFVEENVIA